MHPVKILFIHNAYQQRGGEDAVVEAEIDMLRDHGHAVETYTRHNDEVSTLSKARLARQTLWSNRTQTEVTALIGAFQPDVIHVHNTFPLISPSLYWAAGRAGVPVVQTPHNFRLLCPQAMLLRDGQVCEDCLGRLPWRSITRRCYRGSVAQSGILAGMLALHGVLGTWKDKVTRYIALNEFCRQKFMAGGLPACKIVVKPNFVDWAPPARHADTGADDKDGHFLFVGRLSAEKGIEVLSRAIRQAPELFLRVAGIGPDAASLRAISRVDLLGALPGERVREEMSAALALVMPSVCQENFPRTIIEAFACGLPVIASRLGAMAELIRDGETGLLFEPRNAEELAQKMNWADTNRAAMRQMGMNARREYEAKYTPEINYRQLMGIYTDAIFDKRPSRQATGVA